MGQWKGGGRIEKFIIQWVSRITYVSSKITFSFTPNSNWFDYPESKTKLNNSGVEKIIREAFEKSIIP